MASRAFRIAGTIALHLVATAVIAGLVPMFVLALLTGNGISAALDDVGRMLASLSPARISRAGLFYYAAAMANAIGLPLLVAGAAAIAAPATMWSAAIRAGVLAALAFVAFFIAINLIPGFAAARLSVSASWSVPFYALVVLAYDMLVVPSAAAAHALARRLRFVGV